MNSTTPALPIHQVLPAILTHLERQDRLLIQAPPGAGKTTVIPLSLLSTEWSNGTIILVQPRRLAVYGAARRMASILNEAIGETIGYRTRYDSKVSARTRIEVVTEGIFLRKIQQDPELTGVCCVIFDEFHERAINIDLAVAFTLEAQRVLRGNDAPLRVLVMSATLDGEGLAHWLECERVESQGQCFPVVTHYFPAPLNNSLEQHLASLVQKALREEEGNVLVFLPGFKEIRRLENLLTENIAPNIKVYPLHASLTAEQQEAAIAPTSGQERKVVLATNVAETSVTIEGIRVVIDSGLVRISRFNERRGMDSLETERISLASADQRRGRAGRVAAGTCYRVWSESDRLRGFTDPEILRADLVPVALELAVWGVNQADQIALPTAPNAESFQRARELLQSLDALDSKGQITATGKQLAQLGLSPRLGLLVLAAQETKTASAGIACAAILSEGDPLRFGKDEWQSNILLRLDALNSRTSAGDLNRGTFQRIQQLCKQLAQRIRHTWSNDFDSSNCATTLAHAFPDRIAQRRSDSKTRYLMANGRGVQLNKYDSLAGSDYLIVLDAAGANTEPQVRMACAISIEEIKSALGSHIKSEQKLEWNAARNAVEAASVTSLGALHLSKSVLPQPWPVEATACLLSAIKGTGLSVLPWTDQTVQLRARVNWLHQQDTSWPMWNDENLLTHLSDWLAPFLIGIYSFAALQSLDLYQALISMLGWEQQQALDKLAPAEWTLETGNTATLDYLPENGPVLSCKMQALYGLNRHPSLPNGSKILIELISPAGRPIQVTRDLPGFWRGSYAEVAKEMRGRYPKHFWPDDPMHATATNKTKKHM